MKKNRFLLLKKIQKPHSVLFTLLHAISPSSKLHNNDLLYRLAFRIEGKEIYPIYVFAKVVSSLEKW